jgi:tRNA threonylcarbamoyladenosine biosynthesis protein TsaE
MPSGADISPVTLSLADEAATRRLGAHLAGLARPRDVIALHGDLGMGKTTLARAFIRALGDSDEEVPSPTFTLVQTYETPRGAVWHVDAYRLKAADEIWELGFEEALAEGIVLIEWPERLGAHLPRRRLDLTLTTDGAGRRAHLASTDIGWARRLEGLA